MPLPGDWKEKALVVYTVAVFSLATLAYYLFQSGDATRCKALLEDGFWLNPAALTNWQPAGCMMHTYKPAEAVACLSARRTVFIGGSSTRDLFNAFASKIDPSFQPATMGLESNVLSTVSGTNLEFIWDPLLSSENLAEIEAGYESVEARPALTVIGPGHEFLQDPANFTHWPSLAADIMSRFGGSNAQKARRSDAVVFAPLMQPDPTGLSTDARENFTPERVASINDVMVELAQEHGVDVATAFDLITQSPNALRGFDLDPKVRTLLSDLLLNRRCNVALPKHYPYASTCCNSYPRPNFQVILGFLFVCIAIPVAFYLYGQGYTSESSAFLQYMPDAKYCGPIFTLGMAVVLSYYCDRSNVFGKEQKQTSASQFFIIMGALIIGSLFTLRTADKDLAFLNRDQTDEWKGWMQVAILVYHYVGVSKTEYIYNYMRVCPTSYLFMTGFGHTVYFLKKGDFSFKRVVATMLRLNLLNVILAYAMGNDWLLYYFAPLVTWNFFVLFAILWVGHEHNKNMKFLFTKMFVGSILNTMFYRIPGVLEAAWWVLQTLFRMQGDMREWRFRVTLDQYSMIPGMIAAVLFINYDSYTWPKSDRFPSFTKLLYFLSAAIMLGYAYFEATQPSKVIYNTKHTYVSWLPCCAFVLLRNSTSWLRRTHNQFFAWFGRGSLETFLLQFHLWLAADTAGLLIVGMPHERLINVVITTVFFLYISSLATSATGPVIEWIMGVEPKPVRPGLPTSHNSHPANLPQVNGHGLAAMTQGSPGDAALLISEKNGPITSAVPINGQPTGKLEMESGSGASAWSKDLRVRVGLILGAMAVANWTYYI